MKRNWSSVLTWAVCFGFLGVTPAPAPTVPTTDEPHHVMVTVTGGAESFDGARLVRFPAVAFGIIEEAVGGSGRKTKRPGSEVLRDCVIDKAFAAHDGWREWRQAVVEQAGYERTVTMSILLPDATEVLEVTLGGAWPSRYEVLADETGTPVQRMTIVYDGLTIR